MTSRTTSPTSTPVHVVREERPMTRRERRIERMRTQYMRHARRTTYRTSGTPYMSRPGWVAEGSAR